MLHNRYIVSKVLRRLTVVSAGIEAAACRASMSSAPSPKRQVAVVGGGVSGLYCAHQLTQHGYAVTVYDLGKNCPGKLSTSSSLADSHMYVRVIAAVNVDPIAAFCNAT